MAFINSCHDQVEYLPNRFQSVISIKPAAYLDKDVYKANDLTYHNIGIGTKPYVLDKAPIISQVGNDASARFCPVRDDLAAFVQFGAPRFKSGVVFAPVTNLSAASLSKAQAVSWDAAGYSMEWLHAGHYGSWLLRARKDWVIPSAMQFPVTVAGLTRTGDQFYRAGVPVCSLRAPVAHDPNDEMNVVQLPYSWGKGTLTIDTSGLKPGIPWVIDPTLVLQPDAAAGKDTALIQFSSHSNNNFGALDTLFVGTVGSGSSTSILAFDLTGIPVAATPTSVTLELVYQDHASKTAGFTVNLHRCLTTWIEGSGVGAPPEVGAPSWTYRVYNSSGWNTSGCNGSGTDRAAALMGSAAIPDPGAGIANFTIDLAEFALMRTTNYGFVALPNAVTAGKFETFPSSDHATSSYRPKLTVEYTLAGGSSKVGLLGGTIQTAWAF